MITITDLKYLRTRLHSLVIFRSILSDDVFGRFDSLLGEIEKKDALAGVDAYGDFVCALFDYGHDFSRYILDYILCDENIYLVKTAKGEDIPGLLKNCVTHELALLKETSLLDSEELRKYIPYEGYLPAWQVSDIDFAHKYEEHLQHILQRGYGVFAKSCMFTVEGVQPVPVAHPDRIRLDELACYENERAAVVKNTLALLEGRPAANILLYGDSGTGKSSTVKAVCNEYCGRGLRLIEIKKSQLHQIPPLIERLAGNPLKFILFIDDLSFTTEDDNFIALKAALEGSVLTRADNIAVYATSNRRHLTRELFSDREGDDVHISETIQQTISLSDRFGLTIPFLMPDKEEYLSIAARIAQSKGLMLKPGELSRQAEVFAIEKGGRSPRIARQLVEHLLSDQ